MIRGQVGTDGENGAGEGREERDKRGVGKGEK